MKHPIPDSNFYYLKANNQHIAVAKQIIFSVLEEYGLIPDDPSLDRDLDDIEKHYQNGYFGLILNELDQFVGTFALYSINEQLAEIRKMYLLPEVRRKGLGSWTVNFLIEKAKASNFEKIELDTASVLKEAMQLYEKLGFKPKDSKNQGPRCDRAYYMDL